MKQFLKLTALSAMLIFSFNSCKKDPCDDKDCKNGATCDDGTCICAEGYEGSDCGTEMRTKFLGVFTVSESCSSGNYNYQMTVNTSSTAAKNVILSNFAGVGVSASGSVSGTSITIPNQTIDVNGTPVTVSGSGQISGNIMTIQYTLSAVGISDSCTATCTKQ